MGRQAKASRSFVRAHAVRAPLRGAVRRALRTGAGLIAASFVLGAEGPLLLMLSIIRTPAIASEHTIATSPNTRMTRVIG